MTTGHSLLDHLLELLTPRASKTPDSHHHNVNAHPDIPWVLCIDDDADYCRALGLLLESHGVAVVRAYDGLRGVQSAFTNSPSAILLDYHLPDAEGDCVLGRLKDTDHTRHIPVIVVTGITDRAIQRTMLDLGAETVLTKPLEFAKLRRELARHINILAGAAPGFEMPACETIL